MRILIVHRAFPGQFVHLARHFASQSGNEIVGVGERSNIPRAAQSVRGAQVMAYGEVEAKGGLDARMRTMLNNGLAVAAGLEGMKKQGYRPDVMLASIMWGEACFLKDVFPEAPLLTYCEYFYAGADIGFDPMVPREPGIEKHQRLINAPLLMALNSSDRGLSPTQWQKDQFPSEYRPRISVIHDGIDTDVVVPSVRDDELIVYAAPNLGPYRGFHVFMRAIPDIQKRRPKARIVIVGGDDADYSPPLPEGKTHRQMMLAELGDRIDHSRVTFIKPLGYGKYLDLLRRSAVRVYLTLPFVLSWSMLDSMAAGGVVIASKTPPVEEVIRDGENGFLVDFSNHEQIAEVVDYAISHESEMRRIRENARQTIVQRYDLKRICLPQQIKLVEGLL